MKDPHPDRDKYDSHPSGFLSFSRKDNGFTKKTDTERTGLWGTISGSLYNRLKSYGILGHSAMEGTFDFEFDLPIKDQDIPMLIQIKKRVETKATETVDIEDLQKQVAEIVGNSKLKRFVAELDKDGMIHPIYFVDFKGKVVSL